MKYIKLYEAYEPINEEWYPQDIYLIDKNKEITSYLEFYGDELIEISGKNRDVDSLIHMILNILIDPSNVNDIVKSHFFGKIKGGLKTKMIKRKLKSIYIQIIDGDEEEKINLLSNYGKLVRGKFYDRNTIGIVLKKPLTLELEIEGL